MSLGVKLLVTGLSLACASCGGYFVYKHASGSSSKTTEEEVSKPVDSQPKGASDPQTAQPEKQQPPAPKQTGDNR